MNISESWSLLPTLQFSGLFNPRTLHPITQSVVAQISQDLLNSIDIRGSADEISRQRRLFSIDGWKNSICNALFQSVLWGESYLLLDFGDTDLRTSPQNQPTPLKVISTKPSWTDWGLQGDGEIDEARFIKFNSPYTFPLGKALDVELQRYDELTDGIVDMVSGQGIIKAGIENLYEILTSKNTENLYSRLSKLKASNTGNGVLAYDLSREDIEIIPKLMGREVESMRVVENRISAITGLPSFIIWGHTDGDGYGVASSLHLYNQRIQSLSDMFLIPIINYILELLGFDLYAETKNIFVETQAEKVDRFNKLVQGLTNLQDIGAMTAIEVRDSVMSQVDLLTLNPNTPVITPPTEVNPDPTNGFSV